MILSPHHSASRKEIHTSFYKQWQDLHRGVEYTPVYPHPSVSGQAIDETIDETMEPFNVSVRETLDFRAMGFAYDGKASDDFELASESFVEPSELERRGAGQVYL